MKHCPFRLEKHTNIKSLRTVNHSLQRKNSIFLDALQMNVHYGIIILTLGVGSVSKLMHYIV